LAIDRVELRRRNRLQMTRCLNRFPTVEPHGSANELDSGDYHAVFDRCLAEFNWAEKTSCEAG
jgi:aerobic carbon-monoxide dehydrogenase large subunit